jgi:PEGA domain
MRKALATLAILLLAAVPSVAQQGHSGGGGAQSGGGSSSHGSGGTASSSGGGSHSSGGGSHSTGGGSHSSGGGSQSGGGTVSRASGGAASGRTGTTNAGQAPPAGGVAVARGGERGNTAGTAGRRGDGTVTGGSAPSSVPSATAGGTTANAGSTATTQGTSREGRKTALSGDGNVDTSMRRGRDRNGNEPITGTAVRRGSVPAPSPPNGGAIIGYYPWWIGAGLYSGYYGYYGGYGYYDPWYGAYPDDPYMSSPGYGGGFADEGSLRLKIKPREAEVYVDGYYAGIVDQFDGIFQRLHIESGPHRIEVRAPGYEPLVFDVRISPDHSTTYEGEMKKIL